VLYAAGSGVVRLFSAIDEKLEDSKLFSRLLPKEIPKCVWGVGGWGWGVAMCSSHAPFILH